MATLYRQYRPQQFSEVAAQGHVISLLQAAIKHSKLGQAYLFYGPRGTGKTSTARILARAINCQNADSLEPCGTCSTCAAIGQGSNPDIIEIDAASNRGIDDIRALQDGINLAPAMSKIKVYIIDEVHMLTREAFTAVLKTLEEPPDHVIFILATTDFHKVPETIVSRCQVFRFKRASAKDLRQRLEDLLKKEKRQVSAEALDFIIKRSDGCFRDAESLLGQALQTTTNQVVFDDVLDMLGLPSNEMMDNFLNALVDGKGAKAIKISEKILAEGYDLEQWISEALTEAKERAITEVKAGRQAGKWPEIMRSLITATQDISVVPNPLLAVQLAVLSTCDDFEPTQETQKNIRTKSSEPARSETPSQPEQKSQSVLEIEKAWPSLIDAIKGDNPVASTFLRAMRPLELADGVLKVEAKYGLHKSFMDQPANQKLITEKLIEISGAEVRIQCELIEGAVANKAGNSHMNNEEALLKNVKEVFG